jgi:two-component system, OmpR family, phosphate regulon response regulator OmpR
MAIDVLFVDDDTELRHILQVFFERQGVGVASLSDGACLEGWLRREQACVIVMDVRMPKLDGLAALKRLRALGDTTPVIMLTTEAAEEVRLRELERGADDILAKPFSPRELLRRIDALAWRDTCLSGGMRS